MARYEELKTPEAVLAAFEARRQIEFWSPDTSVWDNCKFPQIAGSNMSGRGFKYRAMIEEPAIPAGNRVESEQACSVCGGDCSAANPPVLHCPMRDAQPSQQGDAVADLWLGRGSSEGTVGYGLTLRSSAIGRVPPGRYALYTHPLPAEPLGRDAEGVEGLASDDVVIERHWLENIASAACLLEGSGSIIDRREGEALRKLIKSARRLRPQVDEAMADRALWVMFPYPYDEHLRKNWRPKVVDALTAALTEADSHD